MMGDLEDLLLRENSTWFAFNGVDLHCELHGLIPLTPRANNKKAMKRFRTSEN